MKIKNVADIYPLSPTQNGMLFHTLYKPESGMYIEQLGMTFTSDLDIADFKRSWELVTSRHPVLRTAFVWEGVDEAVQVVREHVSLPWEEHEWATVPAADAAARKQAWLHADRARGFELARAPLMRLALIHEASATLHVVWTYHHLILDGASTNQVLQEVFTVYRALRQGQEVALPQPRPYREYIAWLQEQDDAAAENYWRTQLAGFDASTALAVDDLNTDTATPNAVEELEIWLTRDETLSLIAFARAQQLTVNSVVQGAWALLLSRYSGTSDVVHGVTASTRPATLPGAEAMVGLFINTLPLRLAVPPDAQVVTWLRQVQTALVDMRQYDFSELVAVQGWSSVPRGQPLFESIVVFENYGGAAPESAASTGPNFTTWWGEERATYPLTLTVGQGPAMLLRVGFDAQRFDQPSMARLGGHLRQLLTGLTTGPERRLRDIVLLTGEERDQVLAQGHRGLLPDPSPLTLPALVAAQVARTPEANALAWGAHTLTYAEMFSGATQLARFLIRQGVTPGVRVGLAVPRSGDLVVGFLGILLAGAVYVPLDPTWPAPRRAFVLADAHVRLLLTPADGTATDAVPVVDLTTAWPLIAQEDAAPLPALAGPGSLAYLIYTSGSTGQPKGVLVPHRGIGALARAQIAAFGITPTSRVLQFAAPTFDAAIAEIVTALLAGATLVLADEAVLHDPVALLALLTTARISVVTLPPALLATLPVTPLPALQTLVVAGEVCPPATLLAWAAPGRTLINAYGPTEATVCATLAVIAGPGARLPIGRPLAHSEVYLLDAQMQPVPVGVPGDLYLAGLGLADGYLHQPALTAERFGPHPFSGTPGARLYRSGDRGRWLADGQIEYLGRGDTQIKLRGYRVELGEIESQLVQHPSVQAAAVRLDDQRLLAYVVSVTPDAPVGAEKLTAFLGGRLPAYMLPGRYLAVAALPLTATGKLDRRALAGLAVEATAPEGGYLAPRSAVEAELAGIWEAVLGVAPISVDANFFALGGHSLLATQVTSRIRETFEIELPIWTIFEALTIAGLAEAIINQELASADSAVLAEAIRTLN